MGRAENYQSNRQIAFPRYHKDGTPAYIHGQRRHPEASRVRMGLFAAPHNGCGWIATYNALLYRGQYHHPADIVRKYDQNLRFWGLFGLGAGRVAAYLNRAGCPARLIKKPSVQRLAEVFGGQGAAILEYWTRRRTLHYVLVVYGGGQMQVYNAHGDSTGVQACPSAADFFRPGSAALKPRALIMLE